MHDALKLSSTGVPNLWYAKVVQVESE